MNLEYFGLRGALVKDSFAPFGFLIINIFKGRIVYTFRNHSFRHHVNHSKCYSKGIYFFIIKDESISSELNLPTEAFGDGIPYYLKSRILS